MSGTLKKAPSEGDLTKALPETPSEEIHRKKTAVRKTKSVSGLLETRKGYSVPDSRKGIPSGAGGVRLVWRTSTSDFENLNKVLGISQSRRSTSPKPLPTKKDHVFSENFDPLAVQKRASTDTLDSIGSDDNQTDKTLEVPRRRRTKSNESKLKDLEMVSVKSLKSMFENIGKGSNPDSHSVKHVRRSRTITGSEVSVKKSKVVENGIKKPEKDDKKVNNEVENNSQETSKVKTNSSESTQKKANTTPQKNVTQEVNTTTTRPGVIAQEVNATTTRPVVVAQEANATTTHPGVAAQEVNTKTVRSGVELTNVLKVKSLLNIFEGLGKTQSVPSKLNELSKSEKTIFIKKEAVQETKTDLAPKISDEDSKPVLSDDIKETNIKNSVPSDSVINLRKKWETFSSHKTSVSKERDVDSKKIKRELSLDISVKEDLNQTSKSKEAKEEINQTLETSKTDENKGNTQMNDTSLIQTNKPQTTKDQTLGISETEGKQEGSIERNKTFRSSVKDIAKLYEITKSSSRSQSVPTPPSSRPQSAPTTPSSPKKETFPQTMIIKKEVTSSSELKSAKINRYPSSKSLEQLKRRFSVNKEEEHEPKTEENKPKKDSSENSSPVSKEISLGSLERKASVKNIKKYFEASKNAETSNSNIKQKVSAPLEAKKLGEQSATSRVEYSNAEKKKEETIKETKTKALKNEENIKEIKTKVLKNEEAIKETKTKVLKNELSLAVHTNAIKEEKRVDLGEKSPKNLKDQLPSQKEDEVSKGQNEIKIEINNTAIDSPHYKATNKERENSQNTKIEKLMKDFKESEGISKFLNVPKAESLSPNSESDIKDVSDLMKATDTFSYPNKHEDPNVSKLNDENKKYSSINGNNSKNVEESKIIVNKAELKITPYLRSGSRELKPDEIKYFKDMTQFNLSNEFAAKEKPLRERSSSIESSSPTSTLSSADLSKSKLRSSSRQFRDLHNDELRFFGVNYNDNRTKSSKSSSEISLRQEALEKALRLSSLEEDGGRKE